MSYSSTGGFTPRVPSVREVVCTSGTQLQSTAFDPYRHHLTHTWNDTRVLRQSKWLGYRSAKTADQLHLPELLSQHLLTLEQSHIWRLCPPTNTSRVCSEKPLIALPMSEETVFKWIVWFEDSGCDQQQLVNCYLNMSHQKHVSSH